MHILESVLAGGKHILKYVQLGEGKDIIFLHGWGGSRLSFFGVAKRLSASFRVTLVDFYGFGETPHPPFPIDLDYYVNGLKEVIRECKINEYILIGHSFGGRVAIKMAAASSQGLRGIALVDSAGLKPKRSVKFYFKLFLHKLLKKLHIRHNFGSQDYKSLTYPMKSTFINIVGEHLDYLLPYIKIPCLAIWGDKDKDTPIFMAKKILKGIPQSRLVIFVGCGHFSYLQRPNEFYHLIKTFCGGIYVDNNNSGMLSIFNGRRIVAVPDNISK